MSSLPQSGQHWHSEPSRSTARRDAGASDVSDGEGRGLPPFALKILPHFRQARPRNCAHSGRCRTGVTPASPQKPMTEPLQQTRVAARELSRERLVFLQRCRHQLGQADGMEQTPRDAPGECFAERRSGPEARPKERRSRWYGRYREAYREKDRRGGAGRDVPARAFRREYETVGIDAASARLLAQIVFDERRWLRAATARCPARRGEAASRYRRRPA